MIKKTTQEDSKIHNSRLILKTIYDHHSISRVGISRLTGLTRTTVSENVNQFIKESLVIETGTSPSSGGKPAILLRVVDDARHLIGIDLASSEFRGAVVDLRGNILHRIHWPVQDRDGDLALALVYKLIEQLLSLADRPILGIGIGAPGLMDPYQGAALNAVNLDWHALPLGDMLREQFKLPIYIANDSQLAALAEYTFTTQKNITNLILINLSQGVGAGIVLGGKLFYGDNFGAGEIGHVRVMDGGERCRCGNHGCLETLISSRALVKRARDIARQYPQTILNQLSLSPDAIDPEIIFQACEAGDAAVLAMVDEVGRYLGSAIAYLVSALNVNQIVIGGSLARFGDRLIQAVKRQVDQGTLPALARETHIIASDLGEDMVILGAASLLLGQEMGVV
jgi:N-acetylglucosamine repressor